MASSAPLTDQQIAELARRLAALLASAWRNAQAPKEKTTKFA